MKLTPWMLTVATFLIIAALTVGFLFKKLFARETVIPAPPQARRVPMLTSPVEAGTRIERSHLGEGPWDGELTRDTLLDRNSVVGRIAKQDIESASPLAASLFYPIGEVPPIELAPGTRAVSVALGSNTAMVDGLIGQGSFVDVWMTIDATMPVQTSNDVYARRRNESLSLKLFDGVKVIAINGSLKGGRRERDSVVTLELDSKQQAIMVAARHKGSITLTANPEGPGAGGLSVNMTESDRITLREVLGIVEPDIKKPFITEQHRGMQRSVNAYDSDGNLISGRRPGVSDLDPGIIGNGIGSPGRDAWNSSARSGQSVDRNQVTGTRSSSL